MYTSATNADTPAIFEAAEAQTTNKMPLQDVRPEKSTILADLLPYSSKPVEIEKQVDLPLPDDDDSSVSGDERDDHLSDAIEAATGRSDLAKRIGKKNRRIAEKDGKKEVVQPKLGKLTMEMMLKDIEGEEGLADFETQDNAERGMVVGVPEPRFKKERLERDVAYDMTKKELSKWTPHVRKMRSDKTLSFPMNKPTAHLQPSSTALAMNARGGKNEFEDEIQKMLKEANVVAGDKEVEHLQEESGGRSREKERERVKELARMRREMGHYERKMKRMKKIKSKRYRKELKKDRAKAEDEDDTIEGDRKRAEERMRLRHRNTSKWIKRQLDRKDGDKIAVSEQLRLGQELRRKQQSMALDSDDSSDESDGYVPNTTISEKKGKKGLMGMDFMQKAEAKRRTEALALLTEMQNEEGKDDDAVDYSTDRNSGRRVFHGAATGLHSDSDSDLKQPGAGNEEEEEMEQLRSIAAKQENDIDDKVREKLLSSSMNSAQEAFEGNTDGFRTVLVGRLGVNLENAKEEGLSNSLGKPKEASRTDKTLNIRSRSTKKGSDENMADFSLSDSESADGGCEEVGLKCDKKGPEIAARKSVPSAALTGKSSTKNPWLKPVSHEPSQKRASVVKKDDFFNRKEAVASVMSPTTMKRGRLDDSVTVAPHNAKAMDEPIRDLQEEGSSRKKRRRKELQEKHKEDDAEAMRARMEMVSRAFAGAGGADEEEFQAVKAKEVEESLPAAEDIGATVLPGWGSWGGEAIDRKKAKGKWRESEFAKKARMKLEEARKQAKVKRKDGQKGLEHVIISEKRVKGQKRLTLATVPFPYANAEEWERSVAVPIGKQFLTPKVHRDGLAPKVRTIRGECIAPIRAGKRAVIETRRERAKLRVESRKGLGK